MPEQTSVHHHVFNFGHEVLSRIMTFTGPRPRLWPESPRIPSFFPTQTVQREISIVNYKLGTLVWVLRGFVMFWIYHSASSASVFIEHLPTVFHKRGWASSGSYYTGANSTSI